MISLKSLLRTVKEAKITKPVRGRETPLDANIQIPGFGVMKRKQLQKSIVRHLHEASKYAKKGEASKAYSVLYKSKVLQRFLETEIQHSGD
ncbi:MAG: hypothetical protein H8E03_01520 [Pelagibacteraceae bacterium]|nr:hypothetical protein [Pelagibacteraceae bacterium]